MNDRVPISLADQLLNSYLDLDMDPDEREAALNDPRVSDGQVLELLNHLSPDRRAACLAYCIRPEVLRDVARTSDVEERRIVAFHPSTPAAVLRDLARDPEGIVRANVVYNPNAEPEVFAWLMADTSPLVREAAEDAFGSDLGIFLRQGRRTVWHKADNGDLP